MAMASDFAQYRYRDEDVLTKFTDYAVNMPDWLIDFFQREITKRDVRGLTNGVITKLAISGEHPLVQITSSFLTSENQTDISGYLPAISVVEADEIEDEKNTNLGYGYRGVFNIDQQWINDYRIKFPSQEVANQDALLTAQQIAAIETFLGTLPSGQQVVTAVIEGYYLQSFLMIGIWCQSVQERNILGNLIRSLLFEARKYLAAERRVKNIFFKTAKGLVNSNFGLILHGQETTMEYLNYFHNITVLKEIPLDAKLNPDNIANINPGFWPAYKPEDNKVIYPPGEELPGSERE